jgi:hypothetical protein
LSSLKRRSGAPGGNHHRLDAPVDLLDGEFVQRDRQGRALALDVTDAQAVGAEVVERRHLIDGGEAAVWILGVEECGQARRRGSRARQRALGP